MTIARFQYTRRRPEVTGETRQSAVERPPAARLEQHVAAAEQAPTGMPVADLADEFADLDDLDDLDDLINLDDMDSAIDTMRDSMGDISREVSREEGDRQI